MNHREMDECDVQHDQKHPCLPKGKSWAGKAMLDNLADQDPRRQNWSGQVKAFLSDIVYSLNPLLM